MYIIVLDKLPTIGLLLYWEKSARLLIKLIKRQLFKIKAMLQINTVSYIHRTLASNWGNANIYWSFEKSEIHNHC